MSSNLNAFKKLLSESKHVCFLAGAGLSAASGIPTFRGAGGLWRQYDAMSLATPEAFRANPSRCWQFYHTRRAVAARAEPNAAHFAIARACFPSLRGPNWNPAARVSFITQNVDGLSPRALEKIEAADQPDATYLEMHGSVWTLMCTTCHKRTVNRESPLTPALAGTELLDLEERVIAVEDLPKCPECTTASTPSGRRGLLRPGTVWFGEMPHHMDEIDSILRRCELLLVVGTSSTVYPAAGFAERVRKRGGKVAVFNLERSEGMRPFLSLLIVVSILFLHTGDDRADFLFLGPCDETLVQALEG